MGVFEKKSCYVIAGASRGLGRSMAINFAKKARRESVMILLSRDMKALKEVETEIKSSCQDVKVVVSGFDQGDLDEKKFNNIFENIFKENNLSIDNFEQAVIVHNAGTLGDNSKYVKDLVNVSELNTHFGVNVTGNILLNSACLKFFTQEKFAHRYVINISSLTAIKAFKSFSLYCTGEFSSVYMSVKLHNFIQCEKIKREQHLCVLGFHKTTIVCCVLFKIHCVTI